MFQVAPEVLSFLPPDVLSFFVWCSLAPDFLSFLCGFWMVFLCARLFKFSGWCSFEGTPTHTNLMEDTTDNEPWFSLWDEKGMKDITEIRQKVLSRLEVKVEGLKTVTFGLRLEDGRLLQCGTAHLFRKRRNGLNFFDERTLYRMMQGVFLVKPAIFDASTVIEEERLMELKNTIVWSDWVKDALIQNEWDINVFEECFAIALREKIFYLAARFEELHKLIEKAQPSRFLRN